MTTPLIPFPSNYTLIKDNGDGTYLIERKEANVTWRETAEVYFDNFYEKNNWKTYNRTKKPA